MAEVNIPSKWMDIYPKDNPQTGLFNSRGPAEWHLDFQGDFSSHLFSLCISCFPEHKYVCSGALLTLLSQNHRAGGGGGEVGAVEAAHGATEASAILYTGLTAPRLVTTIIYCIKCKQRSQVLFL